MNDETNNMTIDADCLEIVRKHAARLAGLGESSALAEALRDLIFVGADAVDFALGVLPNRSAPATHSTPAPAAKRVRAKRVPRHDASRRMLSAEEMSTLSVLTADRGEIAVCAVIGMAPTTMRRARKGGVMNRATIAALRAYLSENGTEAAV